MTPQDLRALLQAEAQRWLRTPYHHQACEHGEGVDCLMLLVAIFKAAGALPAAFDPRPYAPQWHMHRSDELYLAGLEAWLRPLPVDAIQPGDVVVWQFGRTFSHAGLVVRAEAGHLEVVHALAKARQVIQTRLTDAPLAGRPMRAYTLFAES